MTVKGRKTATYKIIKKEYGNIYQFYCDISGALVKETIPYKRKEPEEELEAAWEFEGKDCFNQCHKCHHNRLLLSGCLSFRLGQKWG